MEMKWIALKDELPLPTQDDIIVFMPWWKRVMSMVSIEARRDAEEFMISQEGWNRGKIFSHWLPLPPLPSDPSLHESIDTNEFSNPGRAKYAIMAGLYMDQLIPVCSYCLTSKCLKHIDPCDQADKNSWIELSVRELLEMDLEHPENWIKSN